VRFHAETHKWQEQQKRDRLKHYAEKYEKSKDKDEPKDRSTSYKKLSHDHNKKANTKGHQSQKNKDSNKKSENKSSSNWSLGKPEMVHTDKEKALEGILEKVQEDRLKVKAC
jgi:hypothetical protein